MTNLERLKIAGAVAIVSLTAGCSTWDSMNHSEKSTAVGAGGGAVAGAVVGGPVGAVVGAGVGGVAGHEVAKEDTSASHRADATVTPRTASDSGFVRSVQQALDAKGYNAGPADGQWGPSTEEALRRFQDSQGIQPTGQLDARTVSALGV